MATPTLRAVLRQRQNPTSVCGFYEQTGTVQTFACGSGFPCLFSHQADPQATPVVHCSGILPRTECFAGTSLPTTGCGAAQLCCPTGQLCGEYNFDYGQGVYYGCAEDAFSINAFSTPPPVLSTTPSAAASSSSLAATAAAASTAAAPPASPSTLPEGSSDSSDDTALAIGLGIFGAIILGCCIGAWWFCIRRNSWFRKRRQQKRYEKMHAINAESPGGVPQSADARLPPAYSASEVSIKPVEPQSGRPAPVATRWKDSDSGTRTFTFRVESIPDDISFDNVKNLFTFVDSKRVTVRSLAPAVRPSMRGLKTATVEWRSLQGKNSQGPTLSRESEQRNIHVDSRFNGWTPLNDARSPIQADVVAVTGLAGHAFGSWAHDHHHSWLRDYLPMDMPNLRVMTYGYDSQLAEQLSRQDLELHAQDFASKLRGLWQSTDYKRPTILIGHSLGCLLIKQALINSTAFPERPDALEKIVPLVIFFGAPHGGLATTALETLVKGKPSQSLIEELKPGSPVLESLNYKFKTTAQNIKILSVFERLPTASAIDTGSGVWKREGPPVMMVERTNARLFWSDEEAISSQTDHKQISKLERTEGGTYGNVLQAITQVLRLSGRQRSVMSRKVLG